MDAHLSPLLTASALVVLAAALLRLRARSRRGPGAGTALAGKLRARASAGAAERRAALMNGHGAAPWPGGQAGDTPGAGDFGGLAAHAATALDADAALLLAPSRADGPQQLLDLHGLSPTDLLGEEVPVEPPSQLVWEEGLLALLPLADGAEHEAQGRLRNLCVRHARTAGLPIELSAGRRGVLIVAWQRRRDVPSTATRQFETVARLAAEAISRSEGERDLARLLAEADATNRLLADVDADRPPDETLVELCRTAVDLLGARGAGLWLGRGDRMSLRARAGAAVPRRAVASAPLCDEISSRPLDSRPGSPSLTTVPLRFAGPREGALTLLFAEPRAVAHDELQLAKRLGLIATIVIGREDLREEAAGYGEALSLSSRAAVSSLAAALDARDGYTGNHSVAVLDLAERVARNLGLEGEALEQARDTARLHDIGKIGIPDEILRKEGALTAQEWTVMRRHPVIGERILQLVPGFERIADAVRHEHERWDGKGYPDGIAGEAIPLAARIVLVCDAYHAMVSDRPFRGAMPKERALEELRAGAGSHFDPAVVEALLEELEDERPQRSAARQWASRVAP